MRSAPPVAIVVDSAASLPHDIALAPQMHVVPMRVTLGDRTYLDGHDLSPAEFYRMLRESTAVPSTAAPSPGSFLEAIRSATHEAESVLCLTVASHFSASFESAKAAVREARNAVPGARISVVDSGSAAGGEGLIALEAWRACRRGLGLREVESAAQRVMPKVRMLAFLDTLYYLWKGR